MQSPMGLSPRMRGNPDNPIPTIGEFGSIPAYAGEPGRLLISARPVGVYPRVCGGTKHCRLARRIATGLSPRMRGNRSA